ncbi:MAG: hypothetical protein ACUVQD_05545 [Thermaceae bacterium]
MLRISLSLIAALALLAGCSAKTRYTIQVDVLSFIPENNRGFDLPSGQLSATIPSDRSGQLVQWPSSRQVQNALERGRIEVEWKLKNTDPTDNLTVDYEIRLAPERDENLTDGQEDFVPEGGSGNLSLSPGQEGTFSLNIELKSDQNTRAFDLVKSGSFRILFRIEYNGDGGRVDLEKAEVSLTVRPSALLE